MECIEWQRVYLFQTETQRKMVFIRENDEVKKKGEKHVDLLIFKIFFFLIYLEEKAIAHCVFVPDLKPLQ